MAVYTIYSGPFKQRTGLGPLSFVERLPSFGGHEWIVLCLEVCPLLEVSL